jgi:predicted transcriptional regulator
MKKINFEILLQFSLIIIGAAMMLIGLEFVILKFLGHPHSLFKSISFFALGGILVTASRLYFMFLETLSLATKSIEMHKQNLQSQEMKVSGPFVEEIIITDETSEEEIEALRKKFPMLNDSIDTILKQIGREVISKLPKDINLFTVQQLEEELKKAIANDNFEKAAEIRNELNKRK